MLLSWFSWENFELYFISPCLLELLDAEYRREINTSFFYMQLMANFSLATLNKSTKKKETEIGKEIFLHPASTTEKRQKSKRLIWWNFGLWLCICSCFGVTVTLILVSDIYWLFLKVHLSEWNLLVIWNIKWSSEFLRKLAFLCGNDCILVKIRDNLLCVRNHFMKVSRFYDNSK